MLAVYLIFKRIILFFQEFNVQFLNRLLSSFSQASGFTFYFSSYNNLIWFFNSYFSSIKWSFKVKILLVNLSSSDIKWTLTWIRPSVCDLMMESCWRKESLHLLRWTGRHSYLYNYRQIFLILCLHYHLMEILKLL